jgi:hypothetical protein
LIPKGKSSDISSLEQEYDMSLAQIQGLNMGPDGVVSDESEYKSSAQCGSPDGVMLFQWPSAIFCWINTILPPKISGGSCGGSTIGNSTPRLSVAVPSSIRESVTDVSAYYNQAKLVSVFPKTVILPKESISVKFDFITKENAHIDLPLASTVKLDIISLQS